MVTLGVLLHLVLGARRREPNNGSLAFRQCGHLLVASSLACNNMPFHWLCRQAHWQWIPHGSRDHDFSAGQCIRQWRAILCDVRRMHSSWRCRCALLALLHLNFRLCHQPVLLLRCCNLRLTKLHGYCKATKWRFRMVAPAGLQSRLAGFFGAGLAVLQVIEEEGLQQAAQEVGAHLLARLELLQQGRPYLGDVRGLGLMVGIEVVTDGHSLAHAPKLSHWIKVQLTPPPPECKHLAMLLRVSTWQCAHRIASAFHVLLQHRYAFASAPCGCHDYTYDRRRR